MSAAVVIPEILPFVWAFAPDNPATPADPSRDSRPPEPQVAFYRKYTEAMLRRYVRMSMEAGKVPSLLGKEMFRSKVTSYRVESFEDVVIADLAILRTQMKDLLGNGQPGRLTRLEGRIDIHERTVQRLKGAAGALGAALTFAHLAIDFLLARH
jgi:hypothetical protein